MAETPLPALCDFRCHRIHVFLAARDHGHIGSTLGESERDAAPDTTPTAGDHSHLTVQPKLLMHTHK